MATVKPLRPVPVVRPKPVAAPTVPVKATKPSKALTRAIAAARPVPSKPVAAVPSARQNTLDGSWDKKLTRGIVSPDSSIDLHGHNLSSAHALLDEGLSRAIARGDRVLLLVTGKPPRPESERPHARGAIRAAIADWLAASRHADAIAAVRGAHPRHGGQGALYIVLRRGR
ncbi:Smr/MutS family protein [Sphingomonadaceae bacterium OTU29MARTA1]|nr:Smr/MutS family protein [Sphingomonas sp. Leaf37]USU07160.1 Smr/MutS family protein [Sphingomonadaceae bacterium OTU29LAMAA1]USU10612.1 Smr/MutS family protein [Sphingomonadaceae bacterium OTU29MARTA1]